MTSSIKLMGAPILGVLLGFATPAEADPRWEQTGSLNIARQEHTATLLFDGRVLVVGGLHCTQAEGCTSEASAELYDPDSHTWSLTGSMNFARNGHEATLLPSGMVLVSGGTACDSFGTCMISASAELYDPLSGTWSSTGSLAVPRTGHTATLLDTGQVLAAGGQSCDPQCLVIASAELYDPVSGTWSPTGDMTTSQADHTATQLTSGEVLTAGGFTCDEQGETALSSPPPNATTRSPALGRLTAI
jgi:hypothetical protein